MKNQGVLAKNQFFTSRSWQFFTRQKVLRRKIGGVNFMFRLELHGFGLPKTHFLISFPSDITL